MSKLLTVVAVVIGAFVVGDQFVGSLAQLKQAGNQETSSDLKQLLKASHSDGKVKAASLEMKSQVGNDVQVILAKMQDREAQFEKEFTGHRLDDPLGWEQLSTAEGRAATLKSLDGELAACKSYFSDISKLRLEVGELIKKHGQRSSGTLEQAIAEDGKLERERVALYAKYRKYVESVGSSKLIKKDGETFFVNDADTNRCQKLLDDVMQTEKAFEAHREALLTAREKRGAKMASQIGP